ncbi:MAG TPA: hypothetical protein VMN60_03625 [Longimicrobiales bacterium]|nr:hypothetical protein [Longimicrobiales bacterium]
MRTASMLSALVCATIIAACGGADQEETAPPAAESAPPPAPSMLALADIAGDWTVVGRNEAGDSLAVHTLHVTADTTGWTTTFPGRDPLATRVVAVAGDSVVTVVGPYESVLRPGVQVTLHSTLRHQNGMLAGTFVANYQSAAADSVLTGRFEGRRMQ